MANLTPLAETTTQQTIKPPIVFIKFLPNLVSVGKGPQSSVRRLLSGRRAIGRAWPRAFSWLSAVSGTPPQLLHLAERRLARPRHLVHPGLDRRAVRLVRHRRDEPAELGELGVEPLELRLRRLPTSQYNTMAMDSDYINPDGSLHRNMRVGKDPILSFRDTSLSFAQG